MNNVKIISAREHGCAALHAWPDKTASIIRNGVAVFAALAVVASGDESGFVRFPPATWPPVAAAEPPAEGIVFRLRAAQGVALDPGGSVTQWLDGAGGAIAMAAASSNIVAGSLGGKPSVRFNGGKGLASALPTNWPTDAVSMFIVARPDAAPKAWGSAVFAQPDEPGKNRFVVHLPGADGNVYWDLGAIRTAFRLSEAANARVFEFVAQPGGGQTILCDGIQSAQVTNCGVFRPRDKTLSVGHEHRGEIAEVLVYNRALPAAERQRVGFHLSQTYGLSTAYAGPDAVYPVEFQQAEEIEAVRVAFANADGARRIPFTVEASNDGKNWRPVVDHRLVESPATTAGVVRTLDPAKVRHLRVVAPVASDFIPRLGELIAYRKGAGGDDPLSAQPAQWPDEAPARTNAIDNLHPETLAWIMDHNQPLASDFLTAESPMRKLLMPNGELVPLWQMKQFLDFNFRIQHSPVGLDAQHVEWLRTMSLWYRKLLAHPNFHAYMMARSNPHNYNRFRRAQRNIPVDGWTSGAAGVSNGSKISISMWRFFLGGACLGTLAHETGHCMGYGHDGVHTYGMGESMGAWCDQGVMNYETVDPNTMPLRDHPLPLLPRLPAVALDDLDPIGGATATVFGKGLSVEGKPLTIGGVAFASGLGLAPDTALTYTVPAGATRFVALAGLDGAADAGLPAGVVLEIQADSAPAQLIARSPLLGGTGRRWWSFDAPLPPGTTAIQVRVRGTVHQQALLPVNLCNAGFAFGPQAGRGATAAPPPSGAYYPGSTRLAEENHQGVRTLLAYWPDDTLRARIAYPDGLRHGEHREYFPNGTTAVAAVYVKGLLQGTRAEYDDQGHLLRQEEFKDDLLDGKAQEWSAAGVRMLEAGYRAGKLHGARKIWLATSEAVSVQEYTDGLLNGKSVWFHKNGKVSKEASYASNILAGAYGEWYDTGTQYMACAYSAGQLDGQRQTWHANGRLAEESTYAAGQLEGPHLKYFPDGRKQQEETFAKNLLQGARTFWHSNGNKHIEEHYRNNRQVGKRIVWHANGQVAEESVYSTGYLDGPHLKYYADGRKQLEEAYIKNQLHGSQATWHGNGTNHIAVTYADNRLNGKRTVWHANGQLAEEAVYSSGLLDGPRVVYFPDGRKQTEETYAKNLLQGARTAWHANGQKWQEHGYRDGKLDGRRQDWFADGKPQFDESYRNGVKNGRCRQWDPKGAVREDQEFNARVDVLDGAKETRHPNGKLASVLRYENGLLHGTSRWYHAGGPVSKEAVYVKNQLEGACTEWYATGTSYVSCVYRDNLLTGRRVVWHPNGLVAEASLYSGGLLDGLQVKYDTAGRKQMEASYCKNLLHGPRVYWHPTGAKSSEEDYRDNLLSGRRRVWHAGGQLIEDAGYLDGVRDGKTLAWFPDGKPRLDEEYVSGVKQGRCRQWDAQGRLVSDQQCRQGVPE